MLVATMKKQQGFVRFIIWDPRTVKQLRTVPASESFFNGLHFSDAIRSPHRVVRRKSHRCHSSLFRGRDNCEAFQRLSGLFAAAEIVCPLAILEMIHR